MSKLKGWRKGLDALILGAARASFVWGESDCFMGFAAEAIKLQVGTDLSAPYAGKYNSPITALKLIKAEGYASLAEYIGKHFEQIDMSHAQLGDISGMAGDDTGMALGIVLGERISVRSLQGSGTVERCYAKFAFRIA